MEITNLNTLRVLRARYLLKDRFRRVIETPEGLFRRVAWAVSEAELNFKTKKDRPKIEEAFFDMMSRFEFLPNSPTLMNAGTKMGQLSACFVIPVEDSMESIFGSLKHMAIIHQTGGGTGFSFSHLRPKNDIVYSTMGDASGPVSFMSIYDKATGVVIQGGRRRGANMGVLRCDHPDILEFVEAKLKKGQFTNFNLSVAVTEEFMDCVYKDKVYSLINPRTRKPTMKLKARFVFDRIARCAWRCGDPGLIFIDEINRHNPTPTLGQIEATNPCGEVLLLPYESCNLGSINLSKFVSARGIDWYGLAKRISLGIRFLDDVIEVNRFPLPQIRKMTIANRKVGLGVMGFADLLLKLEIPYNSHKAQRLARELMKFIRKESVSASADLAVERGTFPNYGVSIYVRKNLKMRNATVNSIAPTGTISIIAGCSSGIEPIFAVSFVRNVLGGVKLFEINPIFLHMAEQRGILNERLKDRIRTGSIQGLRFIPKDLRRIFVTAFDISPEDHLKIQTAFQAYTDNSVSKTVNLPKDATVEEVKKIYIMAHQLRCKGITIYRFGTKKDQVLTFEAEKRVRVAPEYSGGCAGSYCTF